MFRGVIGGVGLGFALVTLVSAVEPDGSGANIRDRLLLAMFGVAGTLAVLRCTRLRLELDEWGLTVCHVVGTAKVAWTEIDRLTFRGQIPILVLREGRRIKLQMLAPSDGRGPFDRSRRANLQTLLAALDAHDVPHQSV